VLSAEHGIGVRDGKFCAHLCVDALLDVLPDDLPDDLDDDVTDPYAAAPATAVRASIGLATTAAHVERLLAAVAELAANGPQAEYVQTPQGWVTSDDPREALPARPW
jgi:selenocysteine lyase/cysteine desulfurase